MIEADEDWVNALTEKMNDTEKSNNVHSNVKAAIKSLIENYEGDIYLLKADDLSSPYPEIKKVGKPYIRYFEGIDQVIEQDEEEVRKWLTVFQ